MSWPRRMGVAGFALGAVATTVAVDRLTVSRAVRRQARLALDASGPYGSLRGTPGTAVADDGTGLYYEIDELYAVGESARPVDDGAGGPVPEPVDVPVPAPAPPAPTVVFSHGYCLSQDVWHFQRAALRGAVRAVYWDQRSHGRSQRGRAQRESGRPVSIEQLGRDLKAVLDAAVPEGPVLLVGHSMGGMTMMALAEQFPEYVARRVAGAAFVSTSAGNLAEVTYGFPAAAVRAARRVLPGVLRALGTQPDLVDLGRRAAGDLYAGLVRRYAFGAPGDVDPGVARFAERLIESVPVDVVAEFYPAFGPHEKWRALSLFGGSGAPPVLVLAGERDEITPVAHSERIAAALPAAELVLLPGAGHLVPLEAPREVNDHLAGLLARSIQTHEPAL
ncbi:alpha/beta fold hydrolase [Streptomyces sp. NBC_01803]|uniref:alpha/beta fold hydrolase n=1 Tax=Streptomyces sp. NBC_01803 TaxID=2975946 RepID=UPI002DDC2824|nr:alpha/beta hydrolase [Streptomyces sp. NBC_01803]WSA45817.1 alpha/beta hydrolase [Streptomyces sp. NBC_01803]